MRGEDIMNKNDISIEKAQKKTMMSYARFFLTQDRKILIGWNMIV